MADNEQEMLQQAILHGHEVRDVRARKILTYGVVLMAIVPVIVVILWEFHFRTMAGPNFTGLTAPTIAPAFNLPTRTYPEPRLIRVPGQQLREYKAKETEELNTYGWINVTQKVVRIPIEQAMNLVLQRGLPARKAGVTNTGMSEYELVIKRRVDREKSIREGKPLEE